MLPHDAFVQIFCLTSAMRSGSASRKKDIRFPTKEDMRSGWKSHPAMVRSMHTHIPSIALFSSNHFSNISHFIHKKDNVPERYMLNITLPPQFCRIVVVDVKG